MRNKLLLAVPLLAAILFVGFRQARTIYEYKETCKFSDVNKLANDGWELVAAAGGTDSQCFYLKRAK
jgi:hypothetical protein